MKQLLSEIANCSICASQLAHGVNPVVKASANSKIAIIGQAPGQIVHETGIPWNDKSGTRLREWLGVTDTAFYNTGLFALIPMGFCYPGKSKSGDLPPRPECAPQWHSLLHSRMKDVRLTILIGAYAQRYYLKQRVAKTLTDTVKNFSAFLPQYLPLPHPSPRNNIWLKKNPWFMEDLIPTLQSVIQQNLYHA